MQEIREESLTTVEIDGRVAWLTLNRPRQANAINWPLADSFIQNINRIGADPEIAVIVLTGGGQLFSGGQDLKSIAADTAAGHPDGARELCGALWAVPVPVIAMINGSAVGGGCEIVLCCDLRVMANTTKLALPEIKFGALPAAGGTQRMPRTVGSALANEYLFTGRDIPAEEALRIGLVNRLVPAECLREEVSAFAHGIAARARYALIAAKALTRAADGMPIEQGLVLEAETVRNMATLEERLVERARAASRDEVYAKLFPSVAKP